MAAMLAAGTVVYAPFVNTVIFGGGAAPPVALLGPLLMGATLVLFETLRLCRVVKKAEVPDQHV